MEPNEMDLKSNLKEENSWIEDSNTLVHQSQTLSESCKEEVDCNILDPKFVLLEQSEGIPSRHTCSSEDVDPLSIALVKNEFKNFIASVSCNEKDSLHGSLFKKEECKDFPGSTFIYSQEFHPDVSINGDSGSWIEDSFRHSVIHKTNTHECQTPLSEMRINVVPAWNFTNAELSPETYSTPVPVNDNALCSVAKKTATSSNEIELRARSFKNNSESRKIVNNVKTEAVKVHRYNSQSRELYASHPGGMKRKVNITLQHCGISYIKNCNFEKSPRISRPHRSHSCDYHGPRDDFIRHLNIHSVINEYICDQCGKLFGQKTYLKQHLKIHVAFGDYKCDQCGKLFRQKSYLNHHLKIHRGLKDYKCDQCGKSFGHKCMLERHLKMHLGIKEYKCHECGKSFSQIGNLKIHLRYHFGIKEYKFDECCQSFVEKSNLKSHLKTHSGIKEHKCDQCGQLFWHKNSLKAYLTIHSGIKKYKCDQCGKSFSQKSDLGKHFKIHSGLKEYTCDHCGKSFVRKSNLEQHLKIHSGIKEHTCNQCGKSFCRKSRLKSHLKIHSGIKSV